MRPPLRRRHRSAPSEAPMTPMHMAAMLVVLTAAFAAVNHHLLRLPTSIGLVIIALVASMVTMAVDAIIPGLGGAQMIRGLVESIDFNEGSAENTSELQSIKRTSYAVFC